MIDLWIPPKPAIIRPAAPDLVKASFLPGMFPLAVPQASDGSLALSYTDSFTSTTSGSSFTSGSEDIGNADASRRVIVAVVWSTSTSSPKTLSSATIGGLSATIHQQIAPNGIRSALISRKVPSGLTAVCSVTLSGSVSNCSMFFYRLVNESSSSPYDTASDITLSGSTLSANLSIPSNGVAIGVAIHKTLPLTTFSWTNLTEDVDLVLQANYGRSSAHQNGLASGTLTVTAVASNTPNDGGLNLMSWA